MRMRVMVAVGQRRAHLGAQALDLHTARLTWHTGSMARTRGTTKQRGLSGPHQSDKKRLKAALRPGDTCWRCGKPMTPDQELDRDHIVDRALGGTNGPAVLAHAHCNRSAGATLGNQMRGQRRRIVKAATSSQQPFRTSRQWLASTCRTCGKPADGRAARNCEICGAHYHPNSAEQRTCGRACGVTLRRTVTLTLVKCERWPSSKIYIRPCEHCGTLFTGRTNARRYCSLRCGQTAYNRSRGKHEERHCACGTPLQAARRKCDACVRETKREHKRRQRRQPAARASEARRRRAQLDARRASIA
jgi:hypothetical protein